MGSYQDYLFIAIVLGCFAVAGAVGFLMYRNALRRPASTTIDRTDRVPMFASNDDAPPRFEMRADGRR